MPSKQLLVIVCAALLVLAGCGNSQKPITVTLTSAASAIDQAQSTTLTATVTNDATSGGITFGSPTCSAGSCGTLATNGTSATYTAPATVTSALQVTITASSATDTTKTAQVTITVNPNPSIAQPDASRLSASIGASYSLSLGSGGTAPYTWSITSGTLPAGLTLNASANTGAAVITGTPTAAAVNKTITVQVTDSAKQTATVTLNLTIPLVITTASLPDGELSLAYSGPAFAIQGGSGALASTTPYSIVTGTPHAGLTFDPATGALSGTPTASGSVSLTFQATDSVGATATKTLSLMIHPRVAVSSATLPNASIGVAYNATLSATDGIPGYSNYTITSGALPNGLSLSSDNGTISGKPTCPVNNDNPFSVTVNDSKNVTSLPQDFTIAMNTDALAITQTSLPLAIVGQAYSQQLSTTGGNCGQVTWSVANGSTLPAWLTLDSNGLLHGTPTQPAAAASFTVQATDGTSTPAQALSVTVNSAGVNNAELNGRYAYSLQGFDGSGNLVTIAGSFVADGSGIITGGFEDHFAGDGSSIGGAITGFYSVGADNRGTMTLTTTHGSTPFNFVLGQITSGVASLGQIIESDAAMATGTIKKQDTTAFSGFAASAASFAFGGRGQNSSGRTAIAGQISFNGSGSVSGMMDYVNSSEVASSQSIAGTYAVGDTTNGRGTIAFTSPVALTFSFYIVSATEAYIIDNNPTGTNDSPLTMLALKQASSFPAPSGTSVLYMDSTAHNCPVGQSGSRVELDLLQWTSAGNGTVGGDENDCGTAGTNTSQSFTYTVAANGRTTIGGAGNNPPVLYLVNSTSGFLVGTDSQSIDSGFFEPQSGAPFNNASFAGSYIFGTTPLVVSGGEVGVGAVTLDGLGGVSGTNDFNSSGTITTDTFTDSFTISANGRAVSSNSVSYVISNSKAVMIDGAGSNTPRVSIIQK